MKAPTLAARLTPPGTAAIATIAIVGPESWPMVRATFRGTNGQQLPEQPDPSQLWYGKFGPPPGDEVVLSVHRSRPTPWIEIHSHGGEHVVRWLLDELRKIGATICTGDELLESHEPSPLQSAAARELLRAVTPRTASILLDQYCGAFEASLSEIEADLESNAIASARRRIDELRQFASLGRHLVQPWSIAVCGAPNVGKSSLVNRIVGYSRCIVTPTPGTTRDAVSTAIAIDGWPAEMIDTAGQRVTTDALENSGIELGRTTAQAADLTLWVFDATMPIAKAPDRAMLVWNKIDLAPDAPVPVNAVPTSAETGAGIDVLLRAISQRLVPNPAAPGTAIPFSPSIARQIEAIANLIGESAVAEAITSIRSLRSTSG